MKTSRFLIIAVFIVAALAAAPWWAGPANLRLMGEVLCFLSLAVLWNLLAGYAGLVSIGQQAFVGLGGYTFFSACVFLGLSPYLAIPLAMLASALVAMIFAPLLFRLEGAHFSIGTWVAAETVLLIFGMIPALGGGAGMSLPISVVKAVAEGKSAREAVIYGLILTLSLGTLFGIFALLRSRAGLALMAIRDNGLAAASLGIDIWRTKFLTYVAVGGVSGGIGAVIFLQKLRISPTSAFSLNDWTVFVIFAVVIGGIGRLEGAVIGTLVYFALRETLADYGAIYLIVLGLVAILTMLVARTGIWGTLEQRLGWQLFETTRHPTPVAEP